MRQRYFIFDNERCFGCHGCVAACANVNQTPAGLLWRTVLKLPPHDRANDSVHLSIACNHCRLAPCVKACPCEALEKRARDGIVLHHADRCMGCRYCQMACPYEALRWSAAQGLVSKCTFCVERVDQGMEPACVETCFAGALTQVVVESPDELDGYQHEAPGLVWQDRVAPSIRFITRDQSTRPPRRNPFPPALKPEGNREA